jgi:hypothetical protein
MTKFFCQKIAAGHEGPCLDAKQGATLMGKTFPDPQYLFPDLSDDHVCIYLVLFLLFTSTRHLF